MSPRRRRAFAEPVAGTGRHRNGPGTAQDSVVLSAYRRRAYACPPVAPNRVPPRYRVCYVASRVPGTAATLRIAAVVACEGRHRSGDALCVAIDRLVTLRTFRERSAARRQGAGMTDVTKGMRWARRLMVGAVAAAALP